MPPETHFIPASLATGHCPNCGYALEGLPPAGACPECGRGYDQAAVILYGWARGQHETVANAKASRLVWVILASLVGFVGYIPQILFNPRRDLLYGAAFIVPLLAWQWYRRHQRAGSHPGLIQLRLDSEGCVQFDELAGPSPLGEWAAANAWIYGLVLAIGSLVWYLSGTLNAVVLWIFLAICAVFTGIGWRRGRQFRLAMQLVGEGAITDANAAYYPKTPWKHIRVASLLPVKDDHYRLRLENINRMLTTYVVDAEIRCSPDQARELRQFIDDQIAQSRQP